MGGPDSRPKPWHPRWIAAAGAAYALMVGVLTLLGYALNVQRLTDWEGDGISMFPNTAACAALGGLALLLLPPARERQSWRTGVRLSAGLVGLAGGLTLLEHVARIDLGIDTLLIERPWGQRAAAAPMRMGPPASTSYLIIGAGLLLATYGPNARRVASALGIMTVGIASLSLVGYWFGADQLFGVARLTGIASQTSSVLAAIGIGLIASVPEHGLAAVLRRDDPGGVIVRRLLLPIVAIPLALGWFRVWGQQAGYFDTAFGIALLALLTILMLFALLLWTAEGVSRQAHLIRAAEESVRERDARYRALFEVAVYGVLTIDERGIIETANPAAERLFGYPGSEMIGRNISMLMPEPYRGEHDLYLQKYLGTGVRKVIGIGREVVGRRKDGSTFPMDLAVAEIRTGGKRHFKGIVHDISERKRAEHLLRESEAQFRQMADAMPQIVWTARTDGYIDYYNQRWYEYTGFPRGDYGQASWEPILHPDDVRRCVDTYFGSIKSETPYQIEYRFKDRKTGGYRWFLGRAIPVRDEQGRITRWSGTCTDIDDTKRAEEVLKEADRRKDEFLATLAHELRNPLAPVRNALHLLHQAGGDGKTIEQARGIMERQVSQLVRLVDDLLDVARIAKGKLDLRKQRVELAAVVQNAAEASRPLIDQMGHDLAVTLPPHPVYLDIDPVRIGQVLLNLLNNAAKYTEPGGHIRLTAERHGSDAVVTVTDTGVGIAADKQPHVFDMFTQVDRSPDRAQGGLGLGLTLARRLTEMHDGSIEVHSDGPGTGSAFTVRLPVSLGPAAAEPPPGDGTTAAARCRILVVDDNADGADSLAELFRLLGNTVATAYDGLEAVRAAEAFRPDVVLLDIGLPKLNGCDAARRIRREPWGARTVLIAVTGWGQEEDRRRSQEAGFDYHMVKPVDPQSLTNLLAGLLPAPADVSS